MAKVQNYLEQTDAELTAKLVELKESYFNLRFSHKARQLTNTSEIKNTRREIARVNTEISRRNIERLDAGKTDLIDINKIKMPAKAKVKVAPKTKLTKEEKKLASKATTQAKIAESKPAPKKTVGAKASATAAKAAPKAKATAEKKNIEKKKAAATAVKTPATSKKTAAAKKGAK
ncbi:MAG: 50S ribosomal protein L29 [Firmicutes bacterium]|nr:50S ribosomal protein L29 [Bacillota bacterium]MCL2770820.1 50S ribosomal protein L29 [Bacillota bacterium]